MDGSFATLSDSLRSSGQASIHPMAVVSPGATLGVDVTVGPFCSIGPDAVIHDGVTLKSHVVVEGHTTIGAGTMVYPFATIGMPPQDYKYRGEPTRCVVGANSVLREHVSIHRGTANGRGVTTIGDGCMLMAVVHVAHDCTLGDGVVIANNVVMGGHVSIGDNAVIGGQSALHQFIRIGRGAMVSGVSGVAADVIPFGHIVGHRATLCGLNVIGLRRRGLGRAAILALRQFYRALFLGDGIFADRLERARLANRGPHADPMIAEIIEFCSARSRRGLLHAGGSAEAVAAAAAED